MKAVKIFCSPCFKGDYKTKLRAKLSLKDKFYWWNEIVIYSNIFEGSINPGQLWRNPYEQLFQEGLYPYGLHSPYFLYDIL
jgi:hypothetical protein